MIDAVAVYSDRYLDPDYRLKGDRLDRAMMDVYALRPGQTYLDVGCGRGELVDAALRRGVFAMGCEIVPELTAHPRIVQASLPDLTMPVFDVVSCYDVLEHLEPDDVEPALDSLFSIAGETLILTTNDKPLPLHLTRWNLDRWDYLIRERARGAVRFEFYGVNEWHWRIEA